MVLGSGEYVKVLYGTVTLLVLAIIIKEIPLGTQIIKAAVQQIGPELEEASNAAGANRFDYFRRILLPMLKPTMSLSPSLFLFPPSEISQRSFFSRCTSRVLCLC
jgi:ABC-type Fe3+ transport system permease subunit